MYNDFLVTSILKQLFILKPNFWQYDKARGSFYLHGTDAFVISSNRRTLLVS